MTRSTLARSHRELEVWQRAMELAIISYRLVRVLPRYEQFGLGAQIRRSAVSVPANIAEGFGRRSRREFAHFLAIAKGSLLELDTLLEVARGLAYIPASELGPAADLIDHVSRMLTLLHRHLTHQSANTLAR